MITWSWGVTLGQASTKLAYEAITFICVESMEKWWHKQLWKWKSPIKLKCFCWLALENKRMTGDIYYKRGGYGPIYCPLCKRDDEAVDRLLVHCPVTDH